MNITKTNADFAQPGEKIFARIEFQDIEEYLAIANAVKLHNQLQNGQEITHKDCPICGVEIVQDKLKRKR